jgi:hypothetical protein
MMLQAISQAKWAGALIMILSVICTRSSVGFAEANDVNAVNEPKATAS